MNPVEIRKYSKKIAGELGYKFNDNLPLLDLSGELRTEEEIVARILCLYVCVACSYGFPKKNGIDWLKKEGVYSALSESEISYIEKNKETLKVNFQWQVESLWALAWVAGYHGDFNFYDSCSDDFIKIFPDLKNNDSADSFKGRAELRSFDLVASSIDLSYCLHWAVKDSEIKKAPTPGKIPGRVIRERRRSLEWVASSDDWDSIVMDT